MSNLFGMNFEKEGKGVPETKDNRNVTERFFGIVKRKFWAMLRINLMQVVINIPSMAFSYFILTPILFNFMADNAEGDAFIRLFIAFVVVALQLITVGPLHAGIIYLLRNYAREENAFIWHDFIKGVKENWKRALAVNLIDVLALFAIAAAYRFYSTMSGELSSLGNVLTVLIIMIIVIYTMMHFYIYPMMVTVDLSVKQLYSNALRFAIGKLLPNLGILLIFAAFCLLIFFNIVLGVVLMLIIGFVLPNFLVTFYAYGGIERYIISKVMAES